MATWDDSESSESESDPENEHANVALMAHTDNLYHTELESETEEVYSEVSPNKKIVLESESEPEAEGVFSELTREQLAISLSETLESYGQPRIKYKKLKSNLVSENVNLKTKNSELKETNVKF